MLTVCPKCALTLAVTAADLRVGQGYVRCGRCATVFNALLALSDASTLELPGMAAPPPPPASRPPADAANTGPDAAIASSATATVTVLREPPPDEPRVQAVDEEDEITIDPSLAAAPLDLVLEQTSTVGPTHGEVTPEFVLPPPTDAAADEVDIDLSAAGPEEDPSVAAAAADAESSQAAPFEPQVPPIEVTSTVQTIVMEGSSVSQREDFVDIDTIDSEIAAATRRALEAEARQHLGAPEPAARDLQIRAAAGSSPDQTGTYHALTDPGAAQATAEPVLDEAALAAAFPDDQPADGATDAAGFAATDRGTPYRPSAPPSPASRLWLWSLSAVLLLLVLGLQAIHYWRNDIALRNDWIGRGLSRTYAALGIPLTPNWDLHGYDVRQLGAATNGSGDNAIRVRVRLTNRGSRPQPYPVLRLSLYDRFGKKLAARDLQPRDYLPKVQANGMMSVALQVDSEVAVMDPGPNASSFELDVCMPGPHGLRCASDAPLRPAARP